MLRLIAQRLTALLLAFSVISASAQTVSEPAYANMQRAMGGIIQSATQTMGYAATDPRTYGTLRGVGQATAGVGAAVGTGLLVAGSAPAWASILAVAAVSGAVSYGVGITLDAAVKWAFGSGSTPITSTVIASSPQTRPNVAAALVAGQPYWQGPGGVIAGDYFSALSAVIDCNYGVFCNTSTASHSIAGCRYVNASFGVYYECDVSRTFNNGTVSTNSTYLSAATSSYITTPSPASCPAGSYYRSNNCFVSSFGSPSQTVTPSLTLAQAVAALTAAQKQQPVSYAAMALLINQMWKKAAAEPGYAGVPYSVTSPVTATQVQEWAQANSSSYPTVESLTSSVTSGATGFSPSTSTSTGTALNPATSETAPTATQPSTQPSQINLGPDPNIGSPTLEGTPTAQMILAPLVALFPDLKAYNVPGHSGACPKPTFFVFGTSIVMDQHCTIFEQQRAAMYAAGLLAFTLVALFIVLSA